MRIFLAISICTTMFCGSAASATERDPLKSLKAQWWQSRRQATTPRAAAAVELNNGVDGNGHFDVNLDDYGTFGTSTPWIDNFDPSPDPERGELPDLDTTFATHLRIFTGPTGPNAGDLGANRVCLTTDDFLDGGYNNAGFDDSNGGRTMDFELISENTTDGLPDKTISVFRVFRDDQGIDLNVTLTQSVAVANPGPANEAAASLRQTVEITNNGGSELLLRLNKHIDEDMPWGTVNQFSFWLDDLVGMDFAELGRPQVYAQDEELVTAALILRTVEDMELDPRTTEFVYYAAKEGTSTDRGADCPDYGLGTFETPVWNHFGVPDCYKNFVGGVGLDTPGLSPQITGDSYIGLQIEILLPVGETYTTTFETIYGFRPVPTRFAAPPVTILQVGQHVDEAGLGEVLFTVANNNPGGGGAPAPICELYVDVEAGKLGADGGGSRDAQFTFLREGWTAENCTGFDSNGHALFRLTTECDPQDPNPDNRIIFGESPFKGRFRMRANDATEDTNPETEVVVPPLTMLLSMAQDQPGLAPDDREWTAVCAPGDYSFRPGAIPTNGLWSIRLEGKGFLRVPAMSMWAKGLLLATVAGVGVLSARRSPWTRA